MQNKLVDLNNHLFAAMERLNSEDLSADDLKTEIFRSKAITNIAQAIIQNGNLALKTVKHMDEYRTDGQTTSVPAMLIGEEKAKL